MEVKIAVNASVRALPRAVCRSRTDEATRPCLELKRIILGQTLRIGFGYRLT